MFDRQLFLPQAIERDYPTVEARFHAMFHHWARSVSPPNWSALVRSLRSTVIGRGVTARRVETILVSVDVHTWLVVDVQSHTQSDELPGDDATPPTLDIDPQGKALLSCICGNSQSSRGQRSLDSPSQVHSV